MIRTTPFALLLALAAAAPAAAQMQAYGLKLGATVSTLRTDLPSEDPLTRHGISGVLFAEWNGPGRTSLLTEAGYLERGYSRMAGAEPGTGDDPGYAYRLDRRMQYVTVAALAKLPAVELGPASTYAIAGPRMNALVGRRGEDVPGYDYRSVVWDGTVGIGAEAVRGLPVVAEARYSVGINDALSGGGWGEPAYHRAVDLMVGVKF
ncbi:MAG TPA: outer membrane beta-barrel protein [Longimicrobium sp.]